MSCHSTSEYLCFTSSGILPTASPITSNSLMTAEQVLRSLLNSSKEISLSDFPKEFRNRIQQINKQPEKERDKMLSVLLSTNWNKTEAARKLNCSRMTLYRKISKYNLGKNQPAQMVVSKMQQNTATVSQSAVTLKCRSEILFFDYIMYPTWN